MGVEAVIGFQDMQKIIKENVEFGLLNLEQPCLPVLGVGQESRFGASLVNLHLLRPRDLRVTDCKYFSKLSGVNWSLILPLRLGIRLRGIFLITISLGASGLRD
jgi:hypothetical protein